MHVPIYSGTYDGPPRWYGKTRTRKEYVVIHATANDGTARDEANNAKHRDDAVSSHFYVDNKRLIQSLDTDLMAWHVGSTIGNTRGIAYEITGTNGKSESWWRSNVAWPLLAASIRRDCEEWNIEPQALSVRDIKSGDRTGIITHDQARLAWGKTDHTDPGPNFPMGYLIELVSGVKPAPGKPTTPTTPGTTVGGIVADLPTIQENASGRYVRRAQAMCIAAGGEARKAIEGTGGVDGRFGSGTTRAVKAAQRFYGIDDDGIVGPVTWREFLVG